MTPIGRARRARTRRGMLFNRVPALLGRAAAHAWAARHNRVGVGSSMSRIQTPVGSQTCSMGFMSELRASQCMTSTSCCASEVVVSHAVWAMALYLAYTRFRPKHPSPGEAYYCGGAWSSIRCWWFHPTPPVHFSHHDGWHPIPRLPSFWVHALSVSRPSLKQCKASSITEDTVPPVPSVRSSPTHGSVACDSNSIWDT